MCIRDRQWKLRRGEENTKIDAGPWAHGGGQPEAWVLSESSGDEVATSTARCVEGTCSVVRSVPGSQAWTDAKVCTASVLRGLNHVLGNQLQAIACDCVQDERGRWSVLQIKGIRGTFDRNEAWMPRKKIIVSKEEPFKLWNVKARIATARSRKNAYTSTRTPWRAT